MEGSMLPIGWKPEWDNRYREWYYVNIYTGQSQWQRPWRAAEPPRRPATPKGLPRGWEAEWDANHKEWYYANVYTEFSQWERPTEPVRPAQVKAVEPEQSSGEKPNELVKAFRQRQIKAATSLREKSTAPERWPREKSIERAKSSREILTSSPKPSREKVIEQTWPPPNKSTESAQSSLHTTIEPAQPSQQAPNRPAQPSREKQNDPGSGQKPIERVWSAREKPTEPPLPSRETPIQPAESQEKPARSVPAIENTSGNLGRIIPVVVNEAPMSSNVEELYKALPSPIFFRLLELEKGSRKDPLRGTLWQGVSFEWPISYEAVSYRWSAVDPNQPASIEIDGVHFPIGPELHGALVQFRHEGTERLLWIDQICINQGDTEEKLQQIGIMGDIYSKATTVLIWLGEASDGSDEAMEYFPTFVERVQRDNERAKRHTSSQLPPDIIEYRGALATVLYSLFSRSWFGRVWTVQEAALGQKGELWCGQKSFPLQVFESFQQGCDSDEYGHWGRALSSILSGAGSQDPENPLRPLLSHAQIVSAVKRRTSGSATILNSLRFLDCSENQDRIYSVLRFFNANLVKEIARNRDLTISDLYHLVAVHEIQRGELEYLGAAGLSQQRMSYKIKDRCPTRPYLSLPSWVPDWTYTVRTHSYWVYNRERLQKRGTPLFAAGGSRIDSSGWSLSGDSKVLHTRGVIVDEVKECAAPFRVLQPPRIFADPQTLVTIIGNFYENFQAYIAACMELAEKCSSKYGPSNITGVCRRSLVGGMMPEGRTTTSTGVLTRSTEGAINALFEEFQKTASEYEETFPHRLRLRRSASNPHQNRVPVLKLLDTTQTSEDVSTRNNLTKAMAEACKGRRFFITSRSKYMGVAPDIARPGDKICVVLGCCAPFIIRPKGDRYQLIGECYVEGLMDGEVMKNKNVSVETIAFE